MPIVFSIKCFECESRIDPRCLDPFSLAPLGLVDCEKIAYESLPTMCRKMIYEGLKNRSNLKNMEMNLFFYYQEIFTDRAIIGTHPMPIRVTD